MEAPQGGYPPQHGEQEHPAPDMPPQPEAQAPGPGPSHGGKKKRAYAGQAFEFGVGANAALGGQAQGGGSYGGYPAPAQPQDFPPVPYPGQQPVQPAVEGFAPPPPMGYQPPGGPGYPVQPAPGVSQVTQQMADMTMSGQPPHAPQLSAPLNQLYPTDLLTQPFNVAELEYPPPPVVLPPNVSFVAL